MIKAIIGGLLIDGTGKEPLRDPVIIIADKKIQQVGYAGKVDIPADAEVIDAHEMTILPGLMDAHVHIALPFYPPETEWHVASLRVDTPLATLYAAKHVKDLLEAGFTTVRDLGNLQDYTNSVARSVKKAVDRGILTGSRIIYAGGVHMTGGHHDLGTPGMLRKPENVADGIWSVRKKVREVVRSGADLIKISASGGMAGEIEMPWWRNFTLEEIQAITDEAHALGKKVAAHVYTPDLIKHAIKGGVDSIEHGFPLDQEAIALLVEKRIPLVPTLHVFSEWTISTMEGKVPEHQYKKIIDAAKDCVDSFKKAVESGVKIATGSDITLLAPPAPQHGDNSYEIELMVRYGMSNMDAIVASTKNAAEVMGISDQLGTIERGKIADLLIVDGNPLDDIKVLKNKELIRLVIKEGQISVDRRRPKHH
ncbi:MAG: amidohydrolase family protein [Nitrososphaerales archaeon]